MDHTPRTAGLNVDSLLSEHTGTPPAGAADLNTSLRCESPPPITPRSPPVQGPAREACRSASATSAAQSVGKTQFDVLLHLVQGIDAKLDRLQSDVAVLRSRRFSSEPPQLVSAVDLEDLPLPFPPEHVRRTSLSPSQGAPTVSPRDVTHGESPGVPRLVQGLVSSRSMRAVRLRQFQKVAQDAVASSHESRSPGIPPLPPDRPNTAGKRISMAIPLSSQQRRRISCAPSTTPPQPPPLNESQDLGATVTSVMSPKSDGHREQELRPHVSFVGGGRICDDHEEEWEPPKWLDHNTGGTDQRNSVRDAVERGLARDMGEEEMRLLTEVMNEASYYQQTTSHWTLIPDEPTRALIDTMYLIGTLLELVYASLMVTIGQWNDTPGALVLVWLSLWCVMNALFVVANFRTCFLDEWALVGDQVDEVSAILRHYFFGWFAFDAFMSVPLDLIALLIAGPRSFRVLCCVRMVRCVRVPFLYNLSNPLSPLPRWVKTAYFFTAYIAAIHLMACAWLRISHWEDRHSSGTAVAEGEDLASMMTSEYIAALYFTVTTMTTVGYGDINAGTDFGRMFSILIMVFGVSVYAFVMGNVGHFLANDDLFERQIKEKKKTLSSVMRHYNIPLHVQKEAFCIYPAIIERVIANSEETMKELPDFMQVKMYHYMKISLISTVALFENCSQELLSALAMACARTIVPPKTFLVEAGELGDEMFVIVSGVVEVFAVTPDDEHLWLANLKDGSWFGELCLLHEGTRRLASVRALTACELLRLCKSDFDRVLIRFPEVRSVIEREAQNRMAAATSAGATGDQADDSPSDPELDETASDGKFSATKAMTEEGSLTGLTRPLPPGSVITEDSIEHRPAAPPAAPRELSQEYLRLTQPAQSTLTAPQSPPMRRLSKLSRRSGRNSNASDLPPSPTRHSSLNGPSFFIAALRGSERTLPRTNTADGSPLSPGFKYLHPSEAESGLRRGQSSSSTRGRVGKINRGAVVGNVGCNVDGVGVATPSNSMRDLSPASRRRRNSSLRRHSEDVLGSSPPLGPAPSPGRLPARRVRAAGGARPCRG
eukprot:TRINITY_DN21167_c0_g1_i1.p1 TRINITY_DN21167_c0_g1~~TRINITY_DN21167_c0_g1_i1.p1  ORF type:complete len:1056 (+),score=166.71 TRINITY_DN21167_c0_g1_i1:57-3224(+)